MTIVNAVNKPLTPNEIVILRELEKGPGRFSALRKVYFGEHRAKQQATTSFYMKLKSLEDKKGFVKKTAVGVYEITDSGLEAILAIPETIKLAARTQAQEKFEANMGLKASQAVVAEKEEEVPA